MFSRNAEFILGGLLLTNNTIVFEYSLPIEHLDPCTLTEVSRTVATVGDALGREPTDENVFKCCNIFSPHGQSSGKRYDYEKMFKELCIRMSVRARQARLHGVIGALAIGICVSMCGCSVPGGATSTPTQTTSTTSLGVFQSAVAAFNGQSYVTAAARAIVAAAAKANSLPGVSVSTQCHIGPAPSNANQTEVDLFWGELSLGGGTRIVLDPSNLSLVNVHGTTSPNPNNFTNTCTLNSDGTISVP